MFDAKTSRKIAWSSQLAQEKVEHRICLFLDCLPSFQLKMLRVGHDNSGSNSRWLLEEVVIFSLVRGERYVFKCGNWIDGRHNDIELPLGK